MDKQYVKLRSKGKPFRKVEITEKVGKYLAIHLTSVQIVDDLIMESMDRYTITHIPTGIRFDSLLTLRRAKNLGYLILELIPESILKCRGYKKFQKRVKSELPEQDFKRLRKRCGR